MRPIPTAVLVLAVAVVGCDPTTARSSEGAATVEGATEAAVVPAGHGGSAPATATRSVTAMAEDAPRRVAASRGRAQAASIELGYTRGAADAEIAVVEFSDFGCPYCARFARATFPIIGEEYIEAGTIRWRYVPVVFGFPGGALMGAAAVCAADLEGEDMFWRVHDLFYTRQQALRSETARPRLLDWVSELGVDRDALDRCIDADETSQRLRRHTESARSWFVRGTPTFVVNGVPMSGAAPIGFFRKVFDTVLDPSGL